MGGELVVAYREKGPGLVKLLLEELKLSLVNERGVVHHLELLEDNL